MLTLLQQTSLTLDVSRCADLKWRNQLNELHAVLRPPSLGNHAVKGVYRGRYHVQGEGLGIDHLVKRGRAGDGIRRRRGRVLWWCGAVR